VDQHRPRAVACAVVQAEVVGHGVVWEAVGTWLLREHLAGRLEGVLGWNPEDMVVPLGMHHDDVMVEWPRFHTGGWRLPFLPPSHLLPLLISFSISFLLLLCLELNDITAIRHITISYALDSTNYYKTYTCILLTLAGLLLQR